MEYQNDLSEMDRESRNAPSVSDAESASDGHYWWQRLRESDADALAYFYDQHADWLLRYGLSVIYERAIVKDAVQELFLVIWNSRHTLSAPKSVRFYLMASLRRLILKNVRTDLRLCDPVEDMADIVTTDSAEEMHQAVQKAVRSLPARQQELIFLKFYQKMTYEQIEELTGLKYQILRNTIHRAMKSLRTMLTQHAVTSLTAVFLLFL
ncbi:RNA polymerase sigma factor [Dyadobacter sp. CY323]|uniref:RNA polymerase sigma factor n=1 Tax=Dyadobacter sp. CY323 TaxID=2907302 RepID=UPI001F3D80F1|nr:sigma-70 family RNA polymerase sigma factor [Dyadobacter sp. CY323]MCE6991083.1 sigma-70 family RNA polymerase sigma factor [Dyadobacter sp. CY323]